jgi:hypothetical protein
MYPIQKRGDSWGPSLVNRTVINNWQNNKFSVLKIIIFETMVQKLVHFYISPLVRARELKLAAIEDLD